MRFGRIAVGAVVLFLIYALAVGWIPLGGGVSCLQDDAIEASLRKDAAASARGFFQAMLKGDARAAYAMTSPALKKQVPAAKFDTIVKQTLASGGAAFDGLSVEQAFQVERSGGKTGRVYCGNNETWVAVNAQPDVTQVHVLMSAKSAAHDWALTAWLIRSGTRFQVESFHAGISGIAGRPAGDLAALAQEQDRKGHAFNAYMLMSAASATAYRGADMQIALKPAVDAALAKLRVPEELKGTPPRRWKMGGHNYEIEQATIVGSETKLGLVIQHRDATWDASDHEGEKRNRALIHAFVTSHASYAEAFGFIVARLLRPNEDDGWGTVYDATGGYGAPMPPPGVAPPAADAWIEEQE